MRCRGIQGNVSHPMFWKCTVEESVIIISIKCYWDSVCKRLRWHKAGASCFGLAYASLQVLAYEGCKWLRTLWSGTERPSKSWGRSVVKVIAWCKSLLRLRRSGGYRKAPQAYLHKRALLSFCPWILGVFVASRSAWVLHAAKLL